VHQGLSNVKVKVSCSQCIPWVPAASASRFKQCLADSASEQSDTASEQSDSAAEQSYSAAEQSYSAAKLPPQRPKIPADNASEQSDTASEQSDTAVEQSYSAAKLPPQRPKIPADSAATARGIFLTKVIGSTRASKISLCIIWIEPFTQIVSSASVLRCMPLILSNALNRV
jgi:hypothetical protein